MEQTYTKPDTDSGWFKSGFKEVSKIKGKHYKDKDLNDWNALDFGNLFRDKFRVKTGLSYGGLGIKDKVLLKKLKEEYGSQLLYKMILYVCSAGFDKSHPTIGLLYGFRIGLIEKLHKSEKENKKATNDLEIFLK